MWILGLQLGPTTRVVHHPETVVNDPVTQTCYTKPAYDETVNAIGVRQRPNMFGNGFLGSGGGSQSSTDPAVWILGGPLAAWIFGSL